MKTLKEKHTLLTWMMCMAVKGCKLKCKTLDYEEAISNFLIPSQVFMVQLV